MPLLELSSPGHNLSIYTVPQFPLIIDNFIFTLVLKGRISKKTRYNLSATTLQTPTSDDSGTIDKFETQLIV